MNQYTSSRLEKFDDDDGHYIVTPDTQLTDRCECDCSMVTGAIHD